MGYHPHFFTLGYVTLRWFAGQNRPYCGISFLSFFSECISQGEILWYRHRHNVLRLKRGRTWENETQWILSYGLSNNISLCWDLNYCVRRGCGGNGFKAISFWLHERDEMFLKECRLTGTQRIKAVGIQRFVMNHARQTLTACAQRWCLVSVRFITTDCRDRTLTSYQRTEKVYKLYINKIRNKTDVEHVNS